jgi:hypothetical protein
MQVLNETIRHEIFKMEWKLSTPSTTKEVWDLLFNDTERQSLGTSYEVAVGRFKSSIKMWTHLRGVSEVQAIPELTCLLGRCSTTRRDLLLRHLDGLPNRNDDSSRPRWSLVDRQLTLNGRPIRTVSGPTRATNVVPVLEAFQNEQWPARIDDPLPGGPDQQRLHATIRSLNTGLSGIRFSSDGTGRGYAWRRLTV